MGFPTPPAADSQPSATATHPAHALGPMQRQALAVQALAGTTPLSELAQQAQVSRKFVYQQQAIAAGALSDAFDPASNDEAVLFHLPVTKQWLRQFVLGLVLVGHCPLRGVVEILRDCFDYPLSLGTVHNIVQSAVTPARHVNDQQSLTGVRVGVHDEIFQHRQPVLVGVDTHSSYCYLLRLEDHRDGDTWGVHLLDLRARGLQPDHFVADAGGGLRAGLATAFPEVSCHSDVFHTLREVQQVVTALENKAYQAIQACDRLEEQIASRRWHGRATDRSLVVRLRYAAAAQTRAIELADQVACLACWLRQDVLALAGPCLAERLDLYDFIRAELHARVSEAPTLLRKLVTYLRNQREDVLAFAAGLDRDLADLGAAFDVAAPVVRELFAVQTLASDNPSRWHRDASLRVTLGGRYYLLSQALAAVGRWTVRASSVVENLNSRLRDYFYLRQTLGNDYLALLQFFLNHRRFRRSAYAERVNKSPKELLTGQPHPHWLELLGYTRFSRN